MADERLSIILDGQDQTAGAIKSARGNLSDLGETAQKGKGHLGSLGDALGGVAKIAGGVAIGGGLMQLPGFLSGAATAAQEDEAATIRLQQSIKNLGGDYDATLASVNDAIAAGQKLAFSDDEIRDSFQMLAAATGNSEEALSRQRIAMDLARGANIPLEQASKLLGKVTDENVNVFKRMGITFNETATQQEALTALTEKFGGTGKLTHDQVAAFNDLGVAVKDGATGVQALKAAKDKFDGTGNITKAQVETFSRLGVEVGHVATEADVLAGVQAKFSGQSDAYAQSTAGQFAQAKIAMSELVEGIGGFLLPGITKVGGVLASVAPQVQDFVGGLAAAAQPQIAAFFSQLGEVLTGQVVPALQAFAHWVADVLAPALADFWQGDVLPKLQAFGDVLTGQVLPAVEAFASAVADRLSPPLQQAIGFVAEHKEILAGFAAVVGVALVAAFTSWAIAAGAAAIATIAAAAPVIAVGAAVGLLILGIRELIEHWDGIVERVPALGVALDAVVAVATGAYEVITSGAGAVVAFFTDNWGTISAIAAAAFEPLSGIVQAVWDTVTTIFGDGVTILTSTVQLIADLIQGDWGGAWDNAREIVGAAFDAIVAYTVGLPAQILPILLELAGHFVSWIATDVLPRLPGALAEILTTFATWEGEAVSWAVTNLAELGAKFVSWIATDVLPSLPGELGRILTAAGTALAGLAGVMRQAAIDAVQGFIGGIRGMIGEAVSAVTDLGGSVIGAIKSFGRSPWPVMIAAGEDAANGLIIGFLSRGDEVVGAVVQTLEGMTAIITDQAWLYRAREAMAGLAEQGIFVPWQQVVDQNLPGAQASGEAFSAAVAAGVLDGLPAVQDAVDQVGQAMQVTGGASALGAGGPAPTVTSGGSQGFDPQAVAMFEHGSGLIAMAGELYDRASQLERDAAITYNNGVMAFDHTQEEAANDLAAVTAMQQEAAELQRRAAEMAQHGGMFQQQAADLQNRAAEQQTIAADANRFTAGSLHAVIDANSAELSSLAVTIAQTRTILEAMGPDGPMRAFFETMLAQEEARGQALAEATTFYTQQLAAITHGQEGIAQVQASAADVQAGAADVLSAVAGGFGQSVSAFSEAVAAMPTTPGGAGLSSQGTGGEGGEPSIGPWQPVPGMPGAFYSVVTWPGGGKSTSISTVGGVDPTAAQIQLQQKGLFFDEGGILTEPVLGTGLRSGRPYGFAMAGPEAFGGVGKGWGIDYERLGAAVARALQAAPLYATVTDVRNSLVRYGQRNAGVALP